MPCNCNTANPKCDPCAICTPPGVTGLTTCQPIDPCEDKLPLDCVLYSGQPYDCEVVVTANQTVTSILASLFAYFADTPSTNECCGIEGDATFTNITTTTSSTTTTSTTTTTTTLPPECSFYNITNSNPRTTSVIETYLCGCELLTTITVPSTGITICLQNPIDLEVVSGAINTPTNLGVCSNSDVICPTTTTTTTTPVCTCNIYTVVQENPDMVISHTYTECTESGNVLVTTNFAYGEWLVCACSDILDDVPEGLDISPAGDSCTAPPTTTTTTIDCTNSGGTVTLLESFIMMANLITEIKFHLINTSIPFTVDWGDGIKNTYSGPTLYHTISHTYTGSYSGQIVFYSTDLTGIITFNDADYSNDPSAPLWPGFNCLPGGSLSVTASELSKLDGCAVTEILNIKTTGDVNDLPKSLVRFILWGNGRPGSANCNNTLSGNIANVPPLANFISVLGQNTLTGDIGTLPTPPGLASFGYVISLRGFNTVWGNIADLPTGTSFYNTVRIAGYNTITGDMADFPSDYHVIEIGGGIDDNHTDAYGNTIYGNLSSFNPDVIEFNIRGENTITGNLSSINSLTLKYLYLRGKNTVSGDINDIVAPILENLVLVDDLNLTSVTGSINSLSTSFPSLKVFSTVGPQNLSGDVSGLPNSLLVFQAVGPNTSFTGTWSDLPSNLQQLYNTGGSSVITGNLTDIPSTIKIFNYQTTDTGVLTFTPPHTWANPMQMFQAASATAMSTTNINNLLVSLASMPSWAPVTGTFVSITGLVVRLKGTPTGAGLTAITTLTSYGVTVTIIP
jgi:hypothetical protein